MATVSEPLVSIRDLHVTFTGGVVTAGNGWATPGEGRSAVLTATYRF